MILRNISRDPVQHKEILRGRDEGSPKQVHNVTDASTRSKQQEAQRLLRETGKGAGLKRLKQWTSQELQKHIQGPSRHHSGLNRGKKIKDTPKEEVGDDTVDLDVESKQERVPQSTAISRDGPILPPTSD